MCVYVMLFFAESFKYRAMRCTQNPNILQLIGLVVILLLWLLPPSPPSSLVHMVYDRLLLTSSSFVDVVLVFIVIIRIAVAWHGMAWSVCCRSHMFHRVFALCMRLSSLIGQAHIISIWPGKLTQLQQNQLWQLLLCRRNHRCRYCRFVVVLFLSLNLRRAFAFNINRIFAKCSSAVCTVQYARLTCVN